MYNDFELKKFAINKNKIQMLEISPLSYFVPMVIGVAITIYGSIEFNYSYKRSARIVGLFLGLAGTALSLFSVLSYDFAYRCLNFGFCENFFYILT